MKLIKPMCEWKFTCTETALTALLLLLVCSALGCETDFLVRLSSIFFSFATFSHKQLVNSLYPVIALRVHQSLKMFIRFYECIFNNAANSLANKLRVSHMLKILIVRKKKTLIARRNISDEFETGDTSRIFLTNFY